jgi:hypothetical protein
MDGVCNRGKRMEQRGFRLGEKRNYQFLREAAVSANRGDKNATQVFQILKNQNSICLQINSL